MYGCKKPFKAKEEVIRILRIGTVYDVQNVVANNHSIFMPKYRRKIFDYQKNKSHRGNIEKIVPMKRSQYAKRQKFFQIIHLC